MIRVVKVPQTILITMPERTNLADVIRLPVLAIINTINPAPRAPRKDAVDTLRPLKKDAPPNPIIITKVAPNDAPDEIPITYGSASGF